MLRDIIAKREKELPIFTIGRFLQIAEERKDIISLGPGEPDFNAPKNVIAYAKKMLDKGYTHYSPVGGRTDLKKELVKKLKKENKIYCEEENIIVTTGSTEGLLLGMLCTLDPGEACLVPDPGFLAYRPTVEILNALPLSYPLRQEDGFQLNVDEIEKQIIPEKTKAIVLNTPSNPTGIVYSKKVLEEVADLAVEHNLLVLCDEAYEALVYDDARHVSIGSFNGLEDRVISFFSFSKTYAMPGFRLGYAVGPENIIEAMTKVHIFTSLCAPTISQVTAIEALRHGKKSVEKMRNEYNKRRKFVIKRLNEIQGLVCVEPKGAFYAFPNVASFGKKSLALSEYILKKAKVAVIPGTEFGQNGEGFIRISYATKMHKIRIGLERIEGVLKRL